MAIPKQLSFLSRGPLFEDKALGAYLAQKRTEAIPDLQRRLKALEDWKNALQAAGPRAKESSLESDFYSHVLEAVLGYVTFPKGNATAYLKPPSRLTHFSKEPDAVLGQSVTDFQWFPSVVLEVKRPDTPFDLPQARESHLTPVEQAFEYGDNILGIRWVLVTDMKIIRLYSVDSRHEYLEFDLFRCAEDTSAQKELLALFFLLHRDYLVAGLDQSPTASLLRASRSSQIEIRSSFYEAYYQIRFDLFTSIQQATTTWESQPTEDEFLSATQRLLDRLLFILFLHQATIRRD